jgi:A/G-specific adenine glycosylase
VSEVILQQTRVNQGINYYHRFVERFPDVGSLARASLDEVLKSWQGLGYYTRARNLHKAAGKVWFEHGGKFPGNYDGLRQLPGVGPYTASAIASFCFDEPVAVVDGNVGRVLSRLLGIYTPINSSQGRKFLQEEAGRVINRDDPATHNQAIIEFGALQCTPSQPECGTCPLKDICHAYLNEKVEWLPVKKPKKQKRHRFFHYLEIHRNGYLYMHQRNERDIWNSLYQFPLIESDRELTTGELQQTQAWKQVFKDLHPHVTAVSPTYRHTLTHQKIHARFIRIRLGRSNNHLDENYRAVSMQDLQELAVPRLIDKYLEQENYGKNG